MLLFCDSFDHYATAQIPRKYDVLFGNTQSVGPGGSGRFGTGGMRFVWDGHGVDKILSAMQTWIVGFAFTTESKVNASFFGLRDGASAQLELGFNAGGFLQVTRNGTLLGTGTAVLKANVWHYIEFKATIDNSAGEVEVRVDGATDISLSGIDTQATANATADRFRLGQGGGFSVWGNYDDLYVLDDTGGVNDDFLGDVRVEAIMPSGNGNSSAFDGSDGNTTDNYLLVDDPATQDDDTTYVQSPDVGDKDTYAHGNLTPTAGTVHGLQIVLTARKTDGGTRELVSVARHSGSEVDSSSHAMTASYAMYRDIRETKPGGGAWSISDVNGAEFGQKVAA